MTWTAPILIALLMFTRLATTAAGDPAAPAAVDPIRAELPAAVELTPQEAAVVEGSHELFENAGLDLPTDLVASFHDSVEPCAGNLGLSTIENGTPRVRVCWSHDDEAVERRLQQQALVHEMAHAWADKNLDDATRDAFVEFTGSDSWNLRSSDWTERGTERAADLITWALLDPAVLFVDFDGMSCHGWAAAFELLTDLPAPNTLAGAC